MTILSKLYGLISRKSNTRFISGIADDVFPGDLEQKLMDSVGQEVEVHYINQDIPRIFNDKIIHTSRNSFYLGKSNGSKYLINIHKKDFSNKLNAVKMIKIVDGDILYENKELDFDYSSVQR